jgi:type I restriction enzyme, R subunit
MRVNEEAFEGEIVAWLVEHGYEQPGQKGFDLRTGLDFDLTHAFIGATQEERWGQLVKLHGGPSTAREAFEERLVKELNARGTVDVLRRGVVDRSVTIQLAYFRRVHSRVGPDLVGVAT